MYEELNISESEGVWAAYLALCDLKEETERLQAACAAKTAELAELRDQTAELFAERVAAEGADDDAVHAAMAMWKSDPQSAALAVLGCDIAEAANPYGCNQYGHEWRSPHGANWRARERGVEKKDEKHPEQNNGNKAKPYNVAPKKEIHVDNPEYKTEVNEHLRNVKTVAQQEKEVYDSITKGKLSSTELQNKLKEWRELQNKYYEVLEDFKNKNVGVNVTEQNEVYHTEVKTEDDIMEHYEEISKRYPDKVHAANPYGCNQYGHGFRQPHGAAGGRGQKTFDFFGETQKEVNKDRRKAQRAYDSAEKDTEKALERVKETAEAVERFANSPDDKTKSMDELISEADKLKEANKQAIKDAKAARRRQLEAAREAGKKVKPAFNGNKNGNIDDDLYDEFKDVFDDDEVKSSRTLEELLEEEEIVKSSHYDGYEIDEEVDAANPYGCNQYGHEWKGKHGEGWKPSGRGGNEKPGEKSDSSETLTKEMRRKHEEYEKAQEAYRQARKKVFDLDDEIENAIKNGDSEKADQLEKEQEEARRMWREASSNADRVTKEYREFSKRYRAAKNK